MFGKPRRAEWCLVNDHLPCGIYCSVSFTSINPKAQASALQSIDLEWTFTLVKGGTGVSIAISEALTNQPTPQPFRGAK